RQELIHLLQRQDERYRGRIATYDPERSGVGFLLATQDAQQSPQFWSLVRRLGAARVQLYANTAPILERIAEGRFLLGYNLLGSYAVAAAIRHPELGIVLPRDYTLAMSRLALIPRGAREPDLAREFMDFLLGEEGQRIIADQAGLYAIHPWVQGAFTAAALREELGPALRPIQIGPGLLVYLDQAKRRRFLRQWREALAAER
ncbi:MAG TPA: ABC transporter substrate-binding protein, partial [Nevskiales bacterium]|nr:ABC transporter substrate-binding protein [Nevskiales bacterium]